MNIYNIHDICFSFCLYWGLCVYPVCFKLVIVKCQAANIDALSSFNNKYGVAPAVKVQKQ